MDDVGSAAQ